METLTVFERGEDGRVVNRVTPGCEWVLEGDGEPSELIDGLPCWFDGGNLHLPAAAQSTSRPLWVGEGYLLDPSDPANRPYVEAMQKQAEAIRDATPENPVHFPAGMYALIGESVLGNPYRVSGHELVKIGGRFQDEVPPLAWDTERSFFEQIRDFFNDNLIAGIVWTHRGGQQFAQLRRSDFLGLTWGA